MVLKEALRDSLKLMESDSVGRQWSKTHYAKGYTSYSSWDQIHLLNSNFLKLSEIILNKAQTYSKRLGLRVPKNEPLLMTQFWVNVQGIGGYHSGHIHPQATLSGTIYLQTPPRCGAIRFEDPRLGFFMGGRPSVEKNGKSPFYFEHHPKVGEVILFPSWMRHEVLMNRSRGKRVSLSFNIF